MKKAKCVHTSSKIKNALMEIAANIIIPLSRNTIAISNIRSNFAHTSHIQSASVPMEIFVHMLTHKNRSWLLWFIITMKMKISTCFSIRHNSALSTLQNMINQNVFMLTIGKITEESQILSTSIMARFLASTGKLRIISITIYKDAKTVWNATCAMAGNNSNIILLTTKPWNVKLKDARKDHAPIITPKRKKESSNPKLSPRLLFMCQRIE